MLSLFRLTAKQFLPFFLCNLCLVLPVSSEPIQEKRGSQQITADYDNLSLKAAGVLPYAYADDGKVYVLLGRQAISKIPSSGMWKGFGGKRDPGETLIRTALREAKEESRAVLGDNNPIYDLASFPFDQAIVTAHYHFKYLQVMAPVAWDPEVAQRFQQIYSASPYEMEKLEVRWVAFEELYAALVEAHQAALDQKCAFPSDMNRIIHVKVENDFLPLARDFVETLLANYRNPHDSIHLLARNQVVVPASFSDDQDLMMLLK
jgi:8-oxo-dGTP pyrophosphatase MutT (NUDIX family)